MHPSFSYAALLAIFYLCLRLRKIRIELSLKKGIGNACNEDLSRAALCYSNFTEYAPLVVILLYFVELLGAHYYFLHLLGLFILIGAILNAYGIIQGRHFVRQLGSSIQLSTIVISAFAILKLNGLS